MDVHTVDRPDGVVGDQRVEEEEKEEDEERKWESHGGKCVTDKVGRPNWVLDYRIMQEEAKTESEKGMSVQDLQGRKEKVDVAVSVRRRTSLLHGPIFSAGVRRCIDDLRRLQARSDLSVQELKAINETLDGVFPLWRHVQMVQRDLRCLDQRLLVLRTTVDPHYHPELDDYVY